MKFGDKFTDLRIAKEFTLRHTAFLLGVDVSNLSKVERNILPAPKPEALEQWCDRLGIKDRDELHDLACISRNELPKDIATDEEMTSALPIMFGILRGKKRKQFLRDLQKVLVA